MVRLLVSELAVGGDPADDRTLRAVSAVGRKQAAELEFGLGEGEALLQVLQSCEALS